MGSIIKVIVKGQDISGSLQTTPEIACYEYSARDRISTFVQDVLDSYQDRNIAQTPRGLEVVLICHGRWVERRSMRSVRSWFDEFESTPPNAGATPRIIERYHSRHQRLLQQRDEIERIVATQYPGRTIRQALLAEEQRTLGYGLEFCREGIRLENLHLLTRLPGKISKLGLIACGTAHISEFRGLGQGNNGGDGHRLCSELARRLHTTVEASTEVQVGSGATEPLTSPGLPEGLWVRYNPTGELNPMGRRFPSAYQDTEGNLVGNTTDSGGREVRVRE